MSAAFEQAWVFLKSAYMPQNLEEILGHGSWRAAVEEPEGFRVGQPRVTKVGGPFNVASHVLAGKLAEEHPELVAPETLESAPGPVSELPEGWEVGADGVPMRMYNPYQTFPVFTTQRRGEPIQGRGVFDRANKNMRRDILFDLYEDYPLAHAMKIFDAKGENWAAMNDKEGYVPPSMQSELQARGIDKPVSLIDPMFAGPNEIRARFIPPRLINPDAAQIRRVASEIPTDSADIQEFMEPWYASADQYEQLSPVSYTQDEIRNLLDLHAKDAEEHLSGLPRSMNRMV